MHSEEESRYYIIIIISFILTTGISIIIMHLPMASDQLRVFLFIDYLNLRTALSVEKSIRSSKIIYANKLCH